VQNDRKSTSVYARVAQEIMGNHIIGLYGYEAKNYSSDAFGGEASMFMAMGAPGAAVATAMQFEKVSRYGIDFSYNYGEPIQLWGAYTVGQNVNFANSQSLNVKAFTLSGEWMIADAWMVGAKYDSSWVDLQMLTNTAITPSETVHATLYGIHQIAENVQAILSVTSTANQVLSMGAIGGNTTVVQDSFRTALFAVDIAL